MERKNIEVSFVMPCLNEETTIAKCIFEAKKAFKKNNLSGEVVVSDNGSKDNSVNIAKKAGSVVVHQNKKGYGNAYQKGFISARGKYIVMADSDMTYPIHMLGDFVKELKKGSDFVIGSRFKGKIHSGAMTPLHRYIGNPFLTGVLNLLFNAGVSDAHCGMRAFTKEAYKKMGLTSAGMEFASEMVIRASQCGLKIKEIPIEYYARDIKSPSKLSSFSDGWRHLKFMFSMKFGKKKGVNC